MLFTKYYSSLYRGHYGTTLTVDKIYAVHFCLRDERRFTMEFYGQFSISSYMKKDAILQLVRHLQEIKQ